MNSPYQAPQSEIKSTTIGQLKANAHFISIAYTAVISILTFIAIASVPNFSDLFVGFGSELPKLTQIVVEHHKLYLIFFLISLLLTIALLVKGIFQEQRRKQFFLVATINFVMALLAAGAIIISLYLPIFYLGNVV